jgi:ubiquinone biosynthesis protein COQ4
MLDYKVNYKMLFNALKRAFHHNRDNTIFVAQVIRATSGPALKRCYNKMLMTEEGGRIAYESEEISDYFATLDQRPEGSVGKECVKMFPNQEFLLKVTRRKSNDKWIEAKHPYNWMARRFRDTHDTWHVLAEYPNTGLGEMCITMFAYAQTKSFGWLLLSLGVLLQYGINRTHLRMLFEAYRRGKNAKFLIAEDYDKLFSENLEDARKRLNIEPVRFYVDNFPI